MSLSIGIVGLPNVGKSTLFNALTASKALAANYPFATIEPNSGIVPVPDNRLDVLAKLYSSSKVVPSTVNFLDIAGLVAGASKGEGLGNQFLSHIRSTNAICHVVRAFDNPNITHVSARVDPKKDIETISTELILADLESIESRLSKFEKEVKANPKLNPILQNLKRTQKLLNDGKPANCSDNTDQESMAGLQLITAKPTIYVFNVDEAGLQDKELQDRLSSLVAPSLSLFICAELESQLNDVDESDRAELLESYGQTESGLVKLIHAAYDTMGLQSYLTAGEREVRAWTIKKGSTAPQAAGVIHTDFEKGFIAAEVVKYSDLVNEGSMVKARAAGKVRLEGKDYVMNPDDVVEFRFNV